MKSKLKDTKDLVEDLKDLNEWRKNIPPDEGVDNLTYSAHESGAAVLGGRMATNPGPGIEAGRMTVPLHEEYLSGSNTLYVSILQI